MEIIKCIPAFKDYLWGGSSMKKFYPTLQTPVPLAESWLLSSNKDGESIVSGGKYDGISFSDYIEKSGRSILGKNAEKFNFFPVLIKFIDAKLPLSIQVHPNDEYALKNENSYGKTEMWYIVDAEKDAFIYFGLSKTLSKTEFSQSIENDTILDYLNKVPVKKGDCFFIESGTIHAIGAGIIIAEVQQNSNITYRVYDYDRKDKDGNSRELHIDKAVDVTTLDRLEIAPQNGNTNSHKRLLASCEYFTVEYIGVDDEKIMKQSDKSFQSLICIDGNLNLTYLDQSIAFSEGESIFIPAGNFEYKLDGNGALLKTTV